MTDKLTNFIIFGFLTIASFSQQTDLLIQGKITSRGKAISDVHIYNVSKKVGTISNDIGVFELLVSSKDTLYISSLPFEAKYVQITEKNIASKQVIIELEPVVNQLDEVFLKHLTGDLLNDIANKPNDTLPALGWAYNKKDLYKFKFNDQSIAENRPDPVAKTNPIGKGAGVILPDNRLMEERRLKRELRQKKEFPDLLKRQLGIKYFTETLKIPEENINHFISYCEYRDIIKKYHSNRQLEVIEILKEESFHYNAIKK